MVLFKNKYEDNAFSQQGFPTSQGFFQPYHPAAEPRNNPLLQQR